MTDQQTPPPSMRTVSRSFAASVYVAEGEPTARDITHWLSMMTPGLVDDAGTAIEAKTAINAFYAPFVREAYVAHRPMELIKEAHVDRMARLKPMHGRLMGTTMAFMGPKDAEDVAHKAFLGWGVMGLEVIKEPMGDEPRQAKAHVTAHQPKTLGDPVGCRFPSHLMGIAHIADDVIKGRESVWFDIDAMGLFKCRYSPILCLRILAWLAGDMTLYGGWKREETLAGVKITIPFDDLGKALGAPHIRMRTHFDALVLKPALKDFKAAGARLGFTLHRPTWNTVRGYERVYNGLTLTITRRGRTTTPKPKLKPRAVARPARKPEGDVPLPF
jgi:hypothetical protein